MNKNWKAIATIPCTYFKWSIIHADTSSNFGKQLLEKFPEYFIEAEQKGPCPLSWIKQMSHEVGLKEDCLDGERYPTLFCLEELGVPFIEFDKFGKDAGEMGFQTLPKEINPDAQIGEIVIWKNKQFVVIENREKLEEMALVPAEFVDVDC